MTVPDVEPDLYGVLVTYQRPAALTTALARVAMQTLRLRRLVVVDNAPSAANEEAVRRLADQVEYLPAGENLGPAGGLAVGMERMLHVARDDDWIVLLDDDDPPRSAGLFEAMWRYAQDRLHEDPTTAAVGVAGTRFDRRRGRVLRVADDELSGPVAVDAIAGNQWPMYAVSALRDAGTMRADLFFGFEELELGLRLRDAGRTLYGHGPLWLAGREEFGRLGAGPRPSTALVRPTWRQYYSLRNLIWILRARSTTMSALRVTLLTGFMKPIANLLRSPGLAWAHLRLNSRACRDGWTSRLGRTIEPGA